MKQNAKGPKAAYMGDSVAPSLATSWQCFFQQSLSLRQSLNINLMLI